MAVTRPSLIPTPFASSGLKNTIPETNDPADGLASFDEGFPPITMTPIAAGGIPPAGRDFNGILFDLSAHVTQLNAGLAYYYDSAFATAVSGYSEGALLARADDTGFWFNTTAGNSNDPDAGGAGWVPAWNYGLTAITGLTNSNVTLDQDQYSKPIITLAGTLTGNINLIFPDFVQQWIVVNNTTGSYTITAKTASGTGVAVTQGSATTIFGDGTNIGTILVASAASAAKWTTARDLSLTGDVTATLSSVDGSANVSASATLANSGVSAGSAGSSSTVPAITVDAKGRVTAMSDTAIREATTSVTGILALLDAAGFTTGTDSTKALTAALFARSLGANGWIKLPGGLIFQWGSTTVASPTEMAYAATLAIAFPTAAIKGIVSSDNTSGATAGASYYEFYAISTTQIQAFYQAAGGGNTSSGFSWMALGY